MKQIKNLEQLRKFIKNSLGSWSIAAKKLGSNQEFYHQENKKVGTASVIKLAIAATIFEKIEKKILSPKQKIKILKKDRIIGTGVLKFLKHGVIEISLYDTINLMIAYSDNTATNICLRIVSKGEVNKFLRKKGFYNTTLDEDSISQTIVDDVIYKRKEHTLGYTTAKEMLLFLEQLVNHTLLSKESCECILDMMRNQQADLRFSRYLPTMFNYVNPKISDFGSKTGEVDHPPILCNVGFIANKKKEKICICIFVYNIPSLKLNHFYMDHPVHQNIGKAVKIIFDEFS